MLPLILGGLAAAGVGRAAWRAAGRLRAMPPAVFGAVGAHTDAPFVMGGFKPAMDAHEAREILGLQKGYTQDELNSHHRRLMMTNHPDRGGSTYLSQKINEARRVIGSGRQ